MFIHFSHCEHQFVFLSFCTVHSSNSWLKLTKESRIRKKTASVRFPFPFKQILEVWLAVSWKWLVYLMFQWTGSFKLCECTSSLRKIYYLTWKTVHRAWKLVAVKWVDLAWETSRPMKLQVNQLLPAGSQTYCEKLVEPKQKPNWGYFFEIEVL